MINLRKVFFCIFDALGALLQSVTHIVVFCRECRHHKIVFDIFEVNVLDRVQFNGDYADAALFGFHFRKDIQSPVIHTLNGVPLNCAILKKCVKTLYNFNAIKYNGTITGRKLPHILRDRALTRRNAAKKEVLL